MLETVIKSYYRGATQIDKMSTLSCTIIHAGLITDPVSRQRLLSFQVVLESPFAIRPSTAIPPPAALCENSDWLLLFLIGLLYGSDL